MRTDFAKNVSKSHIKVKQKMKILQCSVPLEIVTYSTKIAFFQKILRLMLTKYPPIPIFEPSIKHSKVESNMSLSRKIFYWWFAILTAFSLSLATLPHHAVPLAGFLSYSLQALLFVISVYIVLKEPIRKNKYIFVNFAVLFAFSFLDHIYSFVGTGALIFSDQLFLRLYLGQYVFFGAYFFVLALAIVYLTIDVLFRDFHTYQKYVITVGIAVMFFGFYYAPYFQDPKYLHHTPDVLDYKTLASSYEEWVDEVGTPPTPETLAEITEMYSWKNGIKTGVLFPEEKLARAQELYAYLPNNWPVLVFKPLYFDALRMSVVCIGFILLFFGYLYMKDPPQGAYIEKMMLLFLVFSSLEVLHDWTAMKEVEWSAASSIWTVGLYVSNFVLALLAGAFSMRLKFITSVKGEFYEQELALSPSAVTRWRDSLDNLVVEKFFNRKLILGRMFVAPNRK